MVTAHHALAWRSLRRFGVSHVRVDEATSRVFDVVTRRLDAIEAGREAAFVVQVCARVASEFRRATARRAHLDELTDEADRHVSDDPSPEELADRRERRALLDEALDMLDDQTRAVFVLHELEQWTMAQIADSLAIPPGTVASRLRRGRTQFEQAALSLRDRLSASGGEP